MGLLFFISDLKLQTVCANIKLKQCPYCKKYGMLIFHGFIYGLNEYRNVVKKGRRIYCSNRGNRSGCGRTISYRLCTYIKQSFLSSETTWQFLSKILNGTSIEKSYYSLNNSFIISISVLYSIWNKFRNNIYEIRTTLSNTISISDTPTDCPIRETIFHLNNITHDNCQNPVEAFQLLFQKSLF